MNLSKCAISFKVGTNKIVNVDWIKTLTLTINALSKINNKKCYIVNKNIGDGNTGFMLIVEGYEIIAKICYINFYEVFFTNIWKTRHDGKLLWKSAPQKKKK